MKLWGRTGQRRTEEIVNIAHVQRALVSWRETPHPADWRVELQFADGTSQLYRDQAAARIIAYLHSCDLPMVYTPERTLRLGGGGTGSYPVRPLPPDDQDDIPF